MFGVLNSSVHDDLTPVKLASSTPSAAPSVAQPRLAVPSGGESAASRASSRGGGARRRLKLRSKSTSPQRKKGQNAKQKAIYKNIQAEWMRQQS